MISGIVVIERGRFEVRDVGPSDGVLRVSGGGSRRTIMRRPDRSGSGDVSSKDYRWLRQFFEWVFSDDFAHAHATYLIEQERAKVQRRTLWDAEAAEIRCHTKSLPPPSRGFQRIGDAATELLSDMTRLEFEGKVLWNDWRRTWEKPRRVARVRTSHQPLSTDQMLSRFERVCKTRNGWQARCPAHEDQNPSLSIRRGDRWWLTYCFAHCTLESICAAVGLKIADLYLGGDDG